MLAVRLRILKSLATPISNKYFGKNKTWRGFLLMPVFTSGSFLIISKILEFKGFVPKFWPDAIDKQVILGFFLGFFYVLFELPNSFMKRKLNIPEGKKSKKYSWLFSFIDQADSAVGCAICYLIFLPASASYFFLIIIWGPLAHLFGNFILYFLKIRKEPF